MRNLIIRAGEVVTCESGHEVMRAKRDIRGSDQVRAADFDPIREGYAIIRGEMVLPCTCGKRVVRGAPDGGVQIHVADGWR